MQFLTISVPSAPHGSALGLGRGNENIPQPVGPSFAGYADRARHLPGLVTSQANLEHLAKNFLLRQARPPNFFCHILLTSEHFSCTKSPVSIVETECCQKDARTSLARLASQRHPAVTGAGSERLAMKEDWNQVRSLKIEATGLVGNWLAQAGFKPGGRVEVRCDQPGTLSLRSLEQPEEAAL
jgi:hypothetical protein